jgi:hypothetical protein
MAFSVPLSLAGNSGAEVSLPGRKSSGDRL